MAKPCPISHVTARQGAIINAEGDVHMIPTMTTHREVQFAESMENATWYTITLRKGVSFTLVYGDEGPKNKAVQLFLDELLTSNVPARTRRSRLPLHNLVGDVMIFMYRPQCYSDLTEQIMDALREVYPPVPDGSYLRDEEEEAAEAILKAGADSDDNDGNEVLRQLGLSIAAVLGDEKKIRKRRRCPMCQTPL